MALSSDETGKRFHPLPPNHAKGRSVGDNNLNAHTNGKVPGGNGAAPVTTKHVKRSRGSKRKRDRSPNTERSQPEKKRFDVMLPTPVVLAYDQLQRMLGTTLGLPRTMRLSSDNDGPKSSVRLRWANYLTIHIDLRVEEIPSRNGGPQTRITITQINGQLRPGGNRDQQREEAYYWKDLLSERSTPHGEDIPLEGFYANWTEGHGTVPGELKFEVKGDALEHMSQSA